jgi:hypothetical protein
MNQFIFLFFLLNIMEEHNVITMFWAGRKEHYVLPKQRGEMK